MKLVNTREYLGVLPFAETARIKSNRHKGIFTSEKTDLEILKIRNLCLKAFKVKLKDFSGKSRRAEFAETRFMFGYIVCERYSSDKRVSLKDIAKYVSPRLKHFAVIYWRNQGKSRLETAETYQPNRDFLTKYNWINEKFPHK